MRYPLILFVFALSFNAYSFKPQMALPSIDEELSQKVHSTDVNRNVASEEELNDSDQKIEKDRTPASIEQVPYRYWIMKF